MPKLFADMDLPAIKRLLPHGVVQKGAVIALVPPAFGQSARWAIVGNDGLLAVPANTTGYTGAPICFSAADLVEILAMDKGATFTVTAPDAEAVDQARARLIAAQAHLNRIQAEYDDANRVYYGNNTTIEQWHAARAAREAATKKMEPARADRDAATNALNKLSGIIISGDTGNYRYSMPDYAEQWLFQCEIAAKGVYGPMPLVMLDDAPYRAHEPILKWLHKHTGGSDRRTLALPTIMPDGIVACDATVLVHAALTSGYGPTIGGQYLLNPGKGKDNIQANAVVRDMISYGHQADTARFTNTIDGHNNTAYAGVKLCPVGAQAFITALKRHKNADMVRIVLAGNDLTITSTTDNQPLVTAVGEIPASAIIAPFDVTVGAMRITEALSAYGKRNKSVLKLSIADAPQLAVFYEVNGIALSAYMMGKVTAPVTAIVPAIVPAPVVAIVPVGAPVTHRESTFRAAHPPPPPPALPAPSMETIRAGMADAEAAGDHDRWIDLARAQVRLYFGPMRRQEGQVA